MYTFIPFKGGIDVYLDHEYLGSAYGAKTETQAIKILMEA